MPLPIGVSDFRDLIEYHDPHGKHYVIAAPGAFLATALIFLMV